MKHIIIILSLFLVVLILPLSELNAQWEQTDFPSCCINSFVVSGKNLFAANPSDIYLSTDNGASWTSIRSGLLKINHNSLTMNVLAVSGLNLFAGTYGSGVFLSTDNGASWTSVNTGLTNKIIFSLAACGTDLYAGTARTDKSTTSGVFRSINNGKTWTEINNGLPNTSVYALAISGTNIIAGTQKGIFLSSNKGLSWSGTNLNDEVHAIAVSGDKIYAGTFKGTFRSTNSGTSWTAIGTGMSKWWIKAFAVSGNNIFAGTDGGGVFMSSDEGTTWRTINTGLKSATIDGLIISDTVIFAGGQRLWQRPLSECLEEDSESENENNDTQKSYLGTKDIHKINFQEYLNDMSSGCMDIDSSNTVYIESILYYDLNKDEKDETIVTAKSCMGGTSGPDIHSVYYLDSSNNLQEYEIDDKPKINTKIIGIPLHPIGNQNYNLTIQDGVLCADYWDCSGREHPLRQYFKFSNSKFIVEKEVYGETCSTSFDCTKARSDREIIACSCDSIAEMDVELSALYKQLAAKLNPENKSKLKKDQQQWLHDFDAIHAYKWLEEFSDRYRTRIAELRNWLDKTK